MNRETFLNALRVRLRALPEAERERCVEDYRGMILDRMEDGAGVRPDQALSAGGGL